MDEKINKKSKAPGGNTSAFLVLCICIALFMTGGGLIAQDFPGICT
ncbi:hypothetical protein [Thermanaerosceptrum fracticalcis]|nr:hypothetical protein [Thermanaerosceptrum fracticalcis]